MSYNHNAGTNSGTGGHRPVTPERYDSHDGDSTTASSAYEELQMRHQLRKQQQQQAQVSAAQQQQQAQAHRKRRQGESPTSVGSAEDMDLLELSLIHI